MRGTRGTAAQLKPADRLMSDRVQGPLYIINLISSNSPMSLEAPELPELGGLAVFRSRRSEDGRDRYRLHLGYFDSQEHAETILPLVRPRYPAAWVAQAPRDSMGSLDDTNVAQFKFIPKAKGAGGSPKALPREKTTSPAAAPKNSSAADISSQSAAILKPQEVLSLLESPQPPTPRALDDAPDKEVAVQDFAVQLAWSTDRPDIRRMPRLAIFDAYTLYTVTLRRAGRVWYGLRLGFFSDPVSARQIALYVRSDFSAAAVVPVSGRECVRAADAVKAASEKALAAEQKKAAAKAAAGASSVAPASTDVIAAQADFRKTLAALDNPDPLRPGPPPAKGRSVAAGKGRPVAPLARRPGELTTEQLLEELGAGEMSLETEGRDTFTDTGVRHLAVAVVKPKKKTFGSLLSRISGRH